MSAAILCATLLGWGCARAPEQSGTDPAPGRAVVEGRVTLEGRPLVGVTLSFSPDSERGTGGSWHPYAITGEEGHYRLIAPDGPGIGTGWYRVAVMVGFDPGGANSGRPSLPARYADPGTSGLKVHVTEEQRRGAYDLQLHR